MYLQNHRSGTNGTPLDARHTNWAKEVAAHGYDPVLFGYTDTSLDPRGLAPGDPWLKSYEGPLPGIRPVCLMTGTPTPWTDWLKARGFEVPANITFAYGNRGEGPDYEDGAAHPKPLKYPAEFDDTAFLVGQAIDYIKGASRPVRRAPLTAPATSTVCRARALQCDVRSGAGAGVHASRDARR